RRRIGRHLLPDLARRRRGLRLDRLRRRHLRRLRQRAGGDGRWAADRNHPVALGLLFRPRLQGRRRLRPLRADPLGAPARADGKAHAMKWRSVRLSWAVIAAALLLYPFVLTGAFYERMGADLLL